jgi:Predicted pPIWI-associating nuclease
MVTADMSPTVTRRVLKLAILEILSKDGCRAVNRFNLIGRSNQSGALEHYMGVVFDGQGRQLAFLEVGQLERDGLLVPTFQDLVAPNDWLVITERGREALARKSLDSLDEALAIIDPHLLEVRAGAWSALSSAEPDALRQAAHSARELIDQTLKLGASDENVKCQPWYRPEKLSQSGITRKHRLKLLVEQRKCDYSENELRIADKACDLVLAVDKRLQAASHAREAPIRADIEDTMLAAEIALRRVLVPSLQ